MESPRAKLLRAATEYLRANGLHDLSLRQLAAAIGTSHRMLLYHFGSFEELLVAIVEQAETEERERLATLVGEGPFDRATVVRAVWRHLTVPELAGQERLFFELYGQALQGRPGTEGFLDRVVTSWLDAVSAIPRAQGIPMATARTQARLDLAVVRGLLLDLLATGDRRGCTKALERYLGVTPYP